ncbi:MAG: cytochrome-c peroxidase [Chloroflexi bacterium]|nr:cytochrome-c peroxidase [Chloroflexota bacterium]
MSQSTPPQTPWDQKPLTARDVWIAGGIIGLILVMIIGGAAYLALNASPQVSPTTAPAISAATATPVPTPPLAALPPVSFPVDNKYSEAKVELGKLLYFDPRMSGDGSTSCNSCHPANDGSWAVSSPISFGYPGTTHWRNSQTILNTAYYTKLNWDGSATSIEKQNSGAWEGTVAGNLDPVMAEERLAQIPEYRKRFKEVFGDEYPVYENALRAVATFQRTIVSKNVPFDKFLGGDQKAISDEAKRGYALFKGKANCLACHNGALVSDNSFHNTAVATAPDFQTNPLRQITVRWQHFARGVSETEYNTAQVDYGLYYVTKVEKDRGKFRTPSLRETCYTAPYMHNGVFNTLNEVVAFYNKGGGSDPNKSPLLKPLNLSDPEQTDLVAFLKSLCGEKIAFTAPTLPPYEVWKKPSGGSQ